MKKRLFIVKVFIIAIIPIIYNFCFVDDTHSFTRIAYDEMYEDGYIDILCVRASHTEFGCDIARLESNTGLNTFNLGSGSQDFQGSYYAIMAANDANGVGKVLLDVTFTTTQKTEAGATETYIIADYIRNPKIKYEYLINAFGLTGIENGIFPVLHGSSITVNTLKEHITKEYRKNSYDYVTYDNGKRYVGQGYVYSDVRVKDDHEFGCNEYIDSNKPMSDFAYEYLIKIIDYCKANNIELVFVDPPMTDATLSVAGDFQAYVNFVKAVADKNEIQYWEFNQAKADTIVIERTDYCDSVHLNGFGAEKYTDALTRMLGNEISDPFFDSFEEKKAQNPDGTL